MIVILGKSSTRPPPQGGRQRASRIRSGELDQSQPVVIDGCLYGQVSKHCSDVCGHDALIGYHCKDADGEGDDYDYACLYGQIRIPMWLGV